MNQLDLPRRNPKTWFDARSVMLFAAIAVSSATMSVHAAQASSQGQSSTVIGPGSSSSTSTSTGTDGSTKAIEQAGSSHERVLRAVESLNGLR